MDAAATPTTGRPRAGAPRDPYGAMLRGGGLPALAVGAVALVVATAVDGRLGAAGSALATAVVVVSFASSVLVLRRTAALDPLLVFAVAMVTYVTKVGLLGLFLLLFAGADWLSPRAFALTAVVTALAWTTGEVVAFTRVRTLVYSHPRDAR